MVSFCVIKYESSKRAQERWAKRNKQYFRDWMKRKREGLTGPFSEADGPDWVAKNREYHLQQKRESTNRRRNDIHVEAIQHYGGGKCFCCGEDEPIFLALDHINGDGAKHRKEVERGHMSQWAKRNGWPPIFRVACHNCNHGLFRLGGICPHQLKKKKKAA